MTVIKRYAGINHELLRDVVCDIFRLYGFSIEYENKKYYAEEKSALKVHIHGKKKTGWFSSQTVEASIIGQLDVETVLTIWGELEIEDIMVTELDKYFRRTEVPELIS
ncbi:MAG: hypothetical protein HXS46_19155 [Theionarchaea archaeon]|nr:hypothetical protein [Theionarchaea archaeon]